MTQATSSFLKTSSLINNQWVRGESRDSFTVENPADRTVLEKLPGLSEDQVHQAIAAAQSAFKDWSVRSPGERSDALFRWYRLVTQHENDLAELMTLEQGKPLKEALGEVRYSASYLKWFAEQCLRSDGDITTTGLRQKRLIQRQPVGVCAAITPWNFPMAMLARKVAAAVAAGCTMVAKPASQTPFSALALADLAVQAELPPGVFNCLVADSKMIGNIFCSSSVIRKLSFTGSTKVGKLLMRESAGQLHKLSLELGGNAPAIVFDDADLDVVTKAVMGAKFRNNGQTCICINRLYVQRGVYDEVVGRLAEEVSALRVGDGCQDGVDVGPLINDSAMDKFVRHRDDALQGGGTLVAEAPLAKDLNGYFVQPCLIRDARHGMLFCREETFGPLLAVIPFEDEDQVVSYANDTGAGLASYLFSRDLGRAMSVADRLEAGMVGVNDAAISNAAAPFGGVKDSGFGREGSEYGLEDYQQIKYTLLSY